MDIEKTWLDELLGILVGGVILSHFGSDLISLTLYALTDFFPLIVVTIWHHVKLRRALAEVRERGPEDREPKESRLVPPLPATSGTREDWLPLPS